jgi:hypothetical protein
MTEKLKNLYAKCLLNFDDIKLLLTEFNEINNDPEAFLHEYFFELRRNIDLYAEEAIYDIERTRIDLINKMNLFEKECLLQSKSLVFNNENSSLKLKFDRISREFDDHYNSFILQNSNKNEQSMKQIVKETKELEQQINEFKSKLIMNKNFIFLQAKTIPPNYLFGKLVVTNYHTSRIENELTG